MLSIEILVLKQCCMCLIRVKLDNKRSLIKEQDKEFLVASVSNTAQIT